MGPLDHPSALAIQRVAERLGSLREDVVFVGGAVVPLLATDPAASDFRTTNDVDLVLEVVTRAEYARFEEALRQHGFRHDTSPGAPVCRWRTEDLGVGAMPQDSAVLGFSNRWYPTALATSWDVVFPDGPAVRVIAAPAFFATKWDAFQDRGRGTDFAGSHDLEDILTVLNAREESVHEARDSPPEVRAALSEAFATLLGADRFLDVLPGLVETGRAAVVQDRLRSIADLAGTR